MGPERGRFFSCCVRIVLYFVVFTLYEMECVKPLNPKTVVLWLFLAIAEISLFFSDDSSLILVAYLVHRVAYVSYYTS